MIDDSTDPGRIDLRALDVAAHAAGDERIVRAILARVHGEARVGDTRPRGVVAILAGYRRTMLAAATILVVVAGALEALTVDRPTRSPRLDETIVTWTEAGHVPTNGELLATFRGYAQ